MIRKVCETCMSIFSVYPYRINTAKYCSPSCGMKWRIGGANNNWKGGRNLMKSGYIRIRVNNAYVYEHRYIMEQSLGRPLYKSETVHHINRNKADNRRENLKLQDKKGHDRLETNLRYKENPKSFRPDKPRCLKPRIRRQNRGEPCQQYLPCRYHPD